MKIFALTLSALLLPAVCFAHSGTVLRAVVNYLPLAMPIFLGFVATAGRALRSLFSRKKP